MQIYTVRVRCLAGALVGTWSGTTLGKHGCPQGWFHPNQTLMAVRPGDLPASSFFLSALGSSDHHQGSTAQGSRNPIALSNPRLFLTNLSSSHLPGTSQAISKRSKLACTLPYPHRMHSQDNLRPSYIITHISHFARADTKQARKSHGSVKIHQQQQLSH